MQFKNIEREVVQERINKCWEVFKGYDLVEGGAPLVYSVGAIDDLVGESFPEVRPEGLDVREDIVRDLENLNLILDGFQFYPMTDLMKGVYSVETDRGLVNCAYLALNGILPDSVLVALKRERVPELGDLLVGDLIRDLGLEDFRVLVNLRKNIFGEKYNLLEIDGKFYLSSNDVLKVLKNYRSIFFLSDFASFVSKEMEEISENSVRRKLFQFIREGRVNGHSSYEGKFCSFKKYGKIAVSLETLNILGNLYLRDRRILKTHFPYYDRTQVVGYGLDQRKIFAKNIDGEIDSRSLLVLPGEGGKNRSNYFCAFDLRDKLGSSFDEAWSSEQKREWLKKVYGSLVLNCDGVFLKDLDFAMVRKRMRIDGSEIETVGLPSGALLCYLTDKVVSSSIWENSPGRRNALALEKIVSCPDLEIRKLFSRGDFLVPAETPNISLKEDSNDFRELSRRSVIEKVYGRGFISLEDLVELGKRSSLGLNVLDGSYPSEKKVLDLHNGRELYVRVLYHALDDVFDYLRKRKNEKNALSALEWIFLGGGKISFEDCCNILFDVDPEKCREKLIELWGLSIKDDVVHISKERKDLRSSKDSGLDERRKMFVLGNSSSINYFGEE